jgi:hypothetical protein
LITDCKNLSVVKGLADEPNATTFLPHRQAVRQHDVKARSFVSLSNRTTHVKGESNMTTSNQVIAWTGTDKRLNVQIGVIGKQTLDETSDNGPAITVFNGSIFLAWTGTNGKLNVISTTDGTHWINKTTLDQTSKVGPALTTSSGSLLLMWTGTDEKLNVMSSVDGVHWGNKTTLNETSKDEPAIAIGAVG